MYKLLRKGLWIVLLFSSQCLNCRAGTVTLLNGDTLHGKINIEESDDEVVVITHPQLGTLRISRDQLKRLPTQKLWSGSLAVGIHGSNTGGDRSGSGAFTTKWNYKKDEHQFKIDGNWNYGLSRDQGESTISVDTNKGALLLRYDKELNEKISGFASSDYLMDAMNKVGVHDQTLSLGIGYKLINNDRTDLNVSIGTSLQTLFGGEKCSRNANCGRVFMASTLTTELNWLINKYFTLNIVDRVSAAYVNGITPANVLSAELKIRPDVKSRMFTTFNIQTMYTSVLKRITISQSILNIKSMRQITINLSYGQVQRTKFIRLKKKFQSEEQ